MAHAEGRAFYVQGWMTRATFAIAGIQLVAAGILALFSRSIGGGPILPSLFAFGAVLTGYQAFWTQRTPLVELRDAGIRLRPALIAGAKDLAFADLRGFAKVEPGWLVLLERSGEETRMPLTAFSESDAEALIAALAEHLTEMSYVED